MSSFAREQSLHGRRRQTQTKGQRERQGRCWLSPPPCPTTLPTASRRSFYLQNPTGFLCHRTVPLFPFPQQHSPPQQLSLHRRQGAQLTAPAWGLSTQQDRAPSKKMSGGRQGHIWIPPERGLLCSQETTQPPTSNPEWLWDLRQSRRAQQSKSHGRWARTKLFSLESQQKRAPAEMCARLRARGSSWNQR